MSIIHSVNFVSKYTQTMKIKKMIQSGSAVINVNAGYQFFNIEPYLV